MLSILKISQRKILLTIAQLQNTILVFNFIVIFKFNFEILGFTRILEHDCPKYDHVIKQYYMSLKVYNIYTTAKSSNY